MINIFVMFLENNKTLKINLIKTVFKTHTFYCFYSIFLEIYFQILKKRFKKKENNFFWNMYHLGEISNRNFCKKY